MMGLTESEVDEQVFQTAMSAIKKGSDKAKETLKKGSNKIKDLINKSDEDTGVDDLGDYNGKPISEILEEIKEKIKEENEDFGTIDVNGETLQFGVGESMSQATSSKIANDNADKSFGRKGNYATEIKKVFLVGNNYITYILKKKLS
jgi:gas vesicle protein